MNLEEESGNRGGKKDKRCINNFTDNLKEYFKYSSNFYLDKGAYSL